MLAFSMLCRVHPWYCVVCEMWALALSVYMQNACLEADIAFVALASCFVDLLSIWMSRSDKLGYVVLHTMVYGLVLLVASSLLLLPPFGTFAHSLGEPNGLLLVSSRLLVIYLALAPLVT